MASIPSRVADNGVHDRYATTTLVKNGIHQPAATLYEEWLTGDVRWAVLSELEPGGYLLPHRDKGPWRHRVQVPIEPGGWYWDLAQGTIAFPEPDVEYQVNHHLPHAVWNDTSWTRIHLVIDRGEPHGDGPFELHPTHLCPELTAFLQS